MSKLYYSKLGSEVTLYDLSASALGQARILILSHRVTTTDLCSLLLHIRHSMGIGTHASVEEASRR